MLERVLPREYALADQAFSQLCALAARHEDFGVLLSVASVRRDKYGLRPFVVFFHP